MMCQNCNENEANVRYTQIINGVKKQMNLCNKCAKELGIDNISFDMQMDFSNFLGDFFDDIKEDFIPSLIKPQELLCDKCKSSYDDFIRNGKLGCDKCYETFEDKIDAILKNIHGANHHVGRNIENIKNIDSKIDNVKVNEINQKEKNEDNEEIKINKKIEELKIRLKREIKEERYEDAAKTRDEIKKLEK